MSYCEYCKGWNRVYDHVQDDTGWCPDCAAKRRAPDPLQVADRLAAAAKEHDAAMVEEFGEPINPRDRSDISWLSLRKLLAEYQAIRKGRQNATDL